MKKNNFKKEKINSQLTYYDLLQGLTLGESIERQNSPQQEMPQYEPTQKDMLLDWIISNEQQANQQGYAGGGLIDSDKGMWDWNSGNAMAAGVTAGSELFKLIGDIGDGFARVNDDAHQAQLNQIGSQSIGYGSTNQRFNNASNLQFANTNLKRKDFGGMSGGEIALDAVKNIGSAAAVGNTLLPGIGGFIGAAAGGLATGIKAIGNYITSGNARDKAIAQAISTNNGIRAGIQYNNNIANDLDTKNQMQGYFGKKGGKIMTHKYNQGGYINSASDAYPRQLTEFNTGGNHEDNPNGGVQQGINPTDGLPNLVEEGETKWNDYIFSKRIYATGGTLKVNHLDDKKYEGKSYAEISQDLFKEYKERPNDHIARITWERAAQNMQNAQEADKLKIKRQQAESVLGLLDLELLDNLQSVMMQQVQAEQQAQAQQEQAMQEQGAEQQMQDEAYQNALYEQEADAALNGVNGIYKHGGHKAQYGTMLDTINVYDTAIPIIPRRRYLDQVEDALLPSNYAYTFPDTDQNLNLQPISRTIPNDSTLAGLDRYWTSKPLPTLIPRNINTESNLSNPEKVDWINDDWSVYDRDKLPMTPGLKPIQYTGVNQNPVIQPTNNTTTNTQKTNNSIPLLRFAPILGSGLNYFKDLIGAQNQNDYSDANLYQRQIDAMTPISAPHIGGYERVNPVDTVYLENAARQQAASTMRQVANASNNNRGYVSVNNAVNAYSLQNNIGDLGIKAAEQNTRERLEVAKFNNAINQINMNADMSVAEKNSAIQQVKAQMYSNLALIRTQERYANESARAQNETNFFTNVGSLGKEIMNTRLINSNLGLYYGINFNTGDIYYKPSYWKLSPEERAKMDLMLQITANIGG